MSIVTTTPAPAAVIAPVVGADLPEDLFDAHALGVLAEIQRGYGHARSVLLSRRRQRSAARRAGGPQPGLPVETSDLRAASWTVAPPPPELTDRRCEITGPADRRMMVSALNSGAQGFMCDLEDAMAPTWDNVVASLRNLRDAAAGTLDALRPDGTVATVGDDPAVMHVRPRGLHLLEPRLRIGGDAVSASLFDVVMVAALTARARLDAGSGLYLYLPKLENRHEAAWWDAVLADVERRFDLPPRCIRVSVLIETLPAAFEMEEILYEMRGRIVALDAGRWDYLFSAIATLGHDPATVLPDRDAVTMRAPFMAAYTARLVDVCRRRGATAIGGMAAQVPQRHDAVATERAMQAVHEDKRREAKNGFQGTWVAHPACVPVALEAFASVIAESAPAHDAHAQVPPVSAMLELHVEGAAVTEAGLHGNVSVVLRYLASWLAGRGAIALDGRMEDLATAEVSRAQLWQWAHHRVELPGGGVIDAELVLGVVERTRADLVAGGWDAARVAEAAAMLLRSTHAHYLPEFLADVAPGPALSTGALTAL